MQHKNLTMAAAVFTLVIVLTISTIFYQNKSTTVSGEDSKQPDSAAGNSTQISNFKDGTYSSRGIYTTPDNQETIGVTLTIENNIVTEAEVISQGVLSTSKNFQAEFISGYKPMVVGKNINDLKLTKVAGSSLTPKGFNDALAKIKDQAKA